MKIRIGNDFKTKWAITWMGEPEDFSDATDISLSFNIYDKKIELIKDVDYTITDNIIEIDVTPDICNILGVYNLELHYTKPNDDFIDGERRSAVDIDAFRIVGKSDKADATQDVSIISDAVAIFLDIAYKKLEEIEANEDVRIANEGEREDAEDIRVANEDIRISNEQDRQTSTATAISNAEQATLNANNSAVYANEQGAYAEEMSSHPPTIINDYWHIWNFTTNQYESTGQYARGDSAIDGALVVQEKGQSAVNTMSQKAVTDELVQLAGDVEQLAYVKIKNEVVNGNFENGSITPFYRVDGGVGASTLAINSSTPISGNYDVRFTIITPSTYTSRPLFYGLNKSANIGDKIYLHFYAKILSGTPRIYGINNGITSSTRYSGDVIDGRNTRVIDVVGTSSDLGVIYFNSTTAWDMQMDNFIHINLTETFGAGNEPTEEEMNLLLDIAGLSYIDDEAIIPAQKIMQWQLKLVSTAEQNADDARLAIQDELALKADRADLAQLEIDYSFKDNLTNPNTGNVEVLSGSYGGDDAIYKIPVQSSVFRMVFDFYMKTDVNNESPHGDIVSFIRSGNVVNSIKTLNAKTTTLFRQHSSNPIEESSLLQVPKYNSGFTILGNSSVRDSLYHEPIVGETIFSIWLKGSDKPLDDFYNTNKVAGEQWLADREQWLSDHRDYAIVIEDDTFSIVRDGIDVTQDAGPFNGGSTSTIYSTSLKSGGEWRTLKSLYEELKSLTEAGGVLENFWMNFYALSSRKTCGDIHQFGKVKLVGRYYQQITNINTDYGVPQQMRYDSFPVLVKYAVDDKKHVCEIVGINGKIYAQVDGEMFSSDIPGLEYITIGGAIKPTNLEVFNGSLGDAEIVNPGQETIISQRSPYTVGIMGHELIDEMEGPGVGDGLAQSLTRMHDICILLRERGYTVVSIDDLIKMRANGIYPSKRIAFFVFDDRRIENVYQNFRHRQAISKYGYPANLASVMSGIYEDNPSVYQPLITAMRGNGWNNLSHSYFHNVSYRVKNSVVLWAELKEILRVADLLNMNNNALCYPFSAGWDVTHTMLEMSGFALAILNNFPYYSKLSRNKYMIARVNMADGQNWNGVRHYIC